MEKVNDILNDGRDAIHHANIAIKANANTIQKLLELSDVITEGKHKTLELDVVNDWLMERQAMRNPAFAAEAMMVRKEYSHFLSIYETYHEEFHKFEIIDGVIQVTEAALEAIREKHISRMHPDVFERYAELHEAYEPLRKLVAKYGKHMAHFILPTTGDDVTVNKQGFHQYHALYGIKTK